MIPIQIEITKAGRAISCYFNTIKRIGRVTTSTIHGCKTAICVSSIGSKRPIATPNHKVQSSVQVKISKARHAEGPDIYTPERIGRIASHPIHGREAAIRISLETGKPTIAASNQKVQIAVIIKIGKGGCGTIANINEG